MPALTFRPLLRDDLLLLHEWLQRPHVQRWWNERDSYDEVVARYLPAIEGSDPTDLYLALLEGEHVAFVQTYLVADYPEYAALVAAHAGAAGVDLFIADEERTGKGLGTELLRRFVDEIVFAPPSTTHCIADPDVENVASIRAFEKAGFHVVRRFVDPADRKRHALVRRDR
jgi:RimJ/RimL family protein N-acetyltransferase